MKIKALFLLIIMMGLGSCFEKEEPVAPYDRGDAQTGTVPMGPDYTYQIYYDLGSNSTIKSNDYMLWDLAFECAKDSYHIKLNTAKFMRLFNTGSMNFDDISDDNISSIEDYEWKYDAPDGRLDTTAFGTWWQLESGSVVSKNEVYLLDLGKDENGRDIGTAKLQILGFDEGYLVKFRKFKEDISHEIKVEKDPEKIFVHLALDNGGQIKDIEPQQQSWDILFSKYTELLYYNEGSRIDSMRYIVTGALLNPKYCKAAMISHKPFEDVSMSDIDSVEFSDAHNSIGHDWKWFDLEDSGSYVINSQMIFLLNDVEGFYYKLHFIDFYNESGEKGHPVFKFKKL